jgi:hypothetical protein
MDNDEQTPLTLSDAQADKIRAAYISMQNGEGISLEETRELARKSTNSWLTNPAPKSA